MIEELSSREAKRAAAAALLARLPEMANHYDVLQGKSEAEWDAYRIFVARDAGGISCYGGLSPDHWINVYGHDAAQAEAMLRRLADERGKAPEFLFGLANVAEPVRRIPLLADANAKWQPFLVMAHTGAVPAAQAAYADWVFERTRAEEAHARLVQEWYAAYNAERAMNWPVPPLAELADPKKRLLLLTTAEGKLAAACANTLYSPERFWIGRMYVLPAFRRTGVGTELLGRMVRLAASEGKSFYLHVDSDNTGAIRMYEAAGCVALGELGYVRYPRG